MVCITCAAFTEFVDAKIAERQIAIAQKNNFKMTDHELTIYGIFANRQGWLAQAHSRLAIFVW